MKLPTDVAADTGVIHATAVWDGTDPATTLRIRDDTPKSESDRACLEWARARADVIVTSGRNLREEPALDHRVAGPRAEDWVRWRAETLGRAEPARSVVLTRSGELDPAHPFWRRSHRPLVLAPPGAAAPLAERLGACQVEVIERTESGLRDALALLRDEWGLATVLVETGPSTSRELYREPVRVDELLLSTWRGEALDPALRGGAFVARSEVERLFGAPLDSQEIREPSGPWRFERFRREIA